MRITRSGGSDVDEYFARFERKMVAAGLVNPGHTLMGFLDDELTWNRNVSGFLFAGPLFEELSINSLMAAIPAEPYATIIRALCSENPDVIYPRDCETRTFLHDLPVSRSTDPLDIAAILKKRKCAIIPGPAIVTYGTVSLEQAFVTFSSVCFTCFVKFFSDYLARFKEGTVDDQHARVFKSVVDMLPEPVENPGALMAGPFKTEEDVLSAMDQAGKMTVDFKLVDSYFGNISCRLGDILYISQTGSSLDDLSGCIDPCSMDGKSCAAITASSELSAHMNIIEKTGCRAILHGHPRFSVILSMDCDVDGCVGGDACYVTCSHERDVLGIPIVPGEVGTGPFGLCNTVPRALEKSPGAIVYGHGLFTVSDKDFNDAFDLLYRVENRCREEYFRRVGLPL
jgi:ribulose-5-phosphate 4-epimerase/fuculose-1-phosphate aldolase